MGSADRETGLNRDPSKPPNGGALFWQRRRPPHPDRGLQLAPAAAARDDLPTPAAYYDLLSPLCAHLDIWHTVYNHVRADAEAIVEWFKGSGLRPFLSPLDDDMRRDFVADYTARIARAYPRRHDGRVLLRFPRRFIVATR
jgi:trans-aconitate 2-methyltransferase